MKPVRCQIEQYSTVQFTGICDSITVGLGNTWLPNGLPSEWNMDVHKLNWKTFLLRPSGGAKCFARLCVQLRPGCVMGMNDGMILFAGWLLIPTLEFI